MKTTFFFLFVIAACSSPTGYVPSEKQEEKGYTDEVISEELRLTTFHGNEHTNKEQAELFAKFRSIEVCQELNKKFSHILLVKDRTHKQEVTETAQVSPNYYYGMSPYYGAGYRWGMTPMAYSAPATQTISKTKTFPSFDVYFECVDLALDARVSLKNLSNYEVRDLVKDTLGAVQVDEVLSESPNTGKLQKGDIVFKVNGQRVGRILDVYKASRRTEQSPATVELIREGKKYETVVTYKDVTELVQEAQEELIKDACEIDKIKDESPLCKD